MTVAAHAQVTPATVPATQTPEATAPPTAPATPPAVLPTPQTPGVAPTLPKVHFIATDAPSLPEFTAKEGDIDVLAMQTTLRNPLHPDDTPFEKDMRTAVVDFLTARRPTDEPMWPDSINPMVWTMRTLKGTNSWWLAMRAIAPPARPFFEGIPFLWQEGPAAAPPPSVSGAAVPSTVLPAANPATAPELSESEKRNNYGLTALLEKGDTAVASDLLVRAVTANKSNSVAEYNAGVLQMALHNPLGAVTMFVRATDHASDLQLKDRANAYIKSTVALNALLKKPDGSGRRLYDESIDTAWDLISAEQYDLAAYIAGQGVVLDPDEKRSEAPLLIAFCYAKQGKIDKSLHWLSESFARYQKSDSGRSELLNLLREGRALPTATK